MNIKHILALVGSTVLASHAFAWDHGGHMAVAKLAYDRLTPAEQQKLTQALAGLGRTGKTYNAVTAACWMDDVRGPHNLYAEWHFVTLPYKGRVAIPPGENAAWAHDYARDVFLGKKRGDEHLVGKDRTYAEAHPPISRAEALAMIMHLDGDLHQPLHCTNHPYTDPDGELHSEDRGGNSVGISNAPEARDSRHPGKMIAEKLHHFWDSAYRQSFVEGQAMEAAEWSRPSSADNPRLGAKVHALLDGETPKQIGLSKPLGWVAESHRYGVKYGYEPLGEDLGKATVTLSQAYVETANEKARERLAQAGVRLAKELKQLLAD